MSVTFRTFRAVSVAGRARCQQCGGWKAATERRPTAIATPVEPPLNLREFWAMVADGFKLLGWVKETPPAPPDLAQAIRSHRQAQIKKTASPSQPVRRDVPSVFGTTTTTDTHPRAASVPAAPNLAAAIRAARKE
jgi:hypothetical protein